MLKGVLDEYWLHCCLPVIFSCRSSWIQIFKYPVLNGQERGDDGQSHCPGGLILLLDISDLEDNLESA